MNTVNDYIHKKINKGIRQPLNLMTGRRKDNWVICTPIIKEMTGGIYLQIFEREPIVSITHHVIEMTLWWDMRIKFKK